jgi:hypothetical protein
MKQHLICKLFGHQFVALRTLSNHSRHIGCNRCLAGWVMNDEFKMLLPMDKEFHEMYRDHFNTFDRLVA